MFNRLLLFAAFLSLVLLTGCAAQKVTSYETSGFMGSYAGLKVGSEGQPNLVYLNPSANFKSYNKILIDHVVIYFNKDSKNKGVDPGELARLSEYFHKSLVRELKYQYTIVEQPGEGVLRIRTAITDVVPGKPVANTLSSIIPIGVAINIIKKSTTDTSLAVGQASIEMELLDSLTGERMAAAIDRREGGKQVVSGKWSAIEEAFDNWAKKLHGFLNLRHALR
jgi:hypothetical protein